MKGLNFNSLGTVNWYIVELEKEGRIERVKKDLMAKEHYQF